MTRQRVVSLIIMLQSSVPHLNFCSYCKLNYPQHEPRCLACGRPEPVGGFPNVAIAQDAIEMSALAAFYDAATQKATDRGYLRKLRAFEKHIEDKTYIVTSCGGDKLTELISNQGVFPTYWSLLSHGERQIANSWDVDRVEAETVTLPGCASEICFGLLALKPEGLSYYGNYQIVWDEAKISHRTTFFIANCVTWRRDKGMTMTQPAPPGLRAVWEKRHQLAAHKHCDELSKITKISDFAKLIIRSDPNGRKGYEIFLEAHIWGELSFESISSFTRVGDHPQEESWEKTAMKALAGKLKAKGIVVKGL